MSWFEEWFNEDYLALYPHRNDDEAEEQVEAVCQWLHLQPGMRILDLGCGAGRHTIALAKRGFDMVGLDLSSTLLEVARKRAPELTFVRRDMRSFGDLGVFDAVLSFFTSFGYFTPEEDQHVLHNVSNALNVGGSFFLDYLHPASVRSDLPIEDDMVVKTIALPHKTYQERVRLYTRAQLEALLSHAGFQITAIYNDYKGNPWRPDGERQLLVSTK